MKYPLSEMIDRLSILRLKKIRLPEDPHVSLELNNFQTAIFKFDVDHKQLQVWLDALIETNGKIWDLEADIRQGREGALGLEEVGRRAIAIRALNRERIQHKNEIARAMNEYEEVKVNHASD